MIIPSTDGNIAGMGSSTVSTWMSAGVFPAIIAATLNAASAVSEPSVATMIDLVFTSGVKRGVVSISLVIISTAVMDPPDFLVGPLECGSCWNVPPRCNKVCQEREEIRSAFSVHW